jgi:hypothetical protein
MRKLLTFLIALAVTVGVSASAFGQSNIIGSGIWGDVKPRASYQGPGDVVSGAVAFYSCRAYSAAKAGTKAYRIVRASDSTQTDVNSSASGLCDTTTPATFCASTTCKYVTWYDQSGANACGGSACDATQSSSSKQAAWTSAALNGWPCAAGASSTSTIEYAAVNAITQAQPLSYIAVTERTGSFTTVNRVIADSGGTQGRLGFQSSANTAVTTGGTALNATAADSAFHALQGLLNGASSALVVDGSATTGNAGTTGLSSAHIDLMGDSTGAAALVGNLCEVGLWPSAFNSTQYGNMNTNMHSSTNGWNF